MPKRNAIPNGRVRRDPTFGLRHKIGIAEMFSTRARKNGMPKMSDVLEIGRVSKPYGAGK